MSERFAVSKWLTGSLGLASDESSDSWVTFTMNGSLEMGNVYACDATANSQCSVSKRTKLHVPISLTGTQTVTCPFILDLSVFISCVN